MAQGTLALTQTFQMLKGSLGSTPIEGRLRGTEITFTAGAATYTGRVNGNAMQGTVGGANWSATKR